jgi:hypothetical protein
MAAGNPDSRSPGVARQLAGLYERMGDAALAGIWKARAELK